MRRVINSFTSGALSPLMAGRLDMAEAMATGCRVLRNFQVHPTGGIFRRSGLRLLYRVKHADKGAVLIPFQRDAETVFQLEAGENYLRVWNPDGTLSAVDLVAPWTDAEVAGITFLQSNDVMLLFWDGPPRVLSRTASGFELKELEWKYPPLREPNIGPVTLTCSVANTGETGVLTADADIFESGHEGSFWEITHVREEPYVKMEMGRGSGDATATLTLRALAVADETVTIGANDVKGNNERKYTWRANDADDLKAYDVTIGTGGARGSAANLAAAINGDGGGPGTLPHPLVSADEGGTFANGVKAAGRLRFDYNDLTSSYPANGFKIGNRVYIYADTLVNPYQIKRGASLADSVENAVKAINGGPGEGTAFGTGTPPHPLVTAAVDEDADGYLIVTANDDSDDATKIETSTPFDGRLFWEDPTLTKGAGTESARLRITALASGEGGNGIPVDEEMDAGSWNETTDGEKKTAGGKSTPAKSDEMRVTGKWEVFSVGEWTGTVRLEKKNGAGWETLRTWTSKGDYNIQATGELETEAVLQLHFQGTGKVTGSPTFNAPNPRAQLTALSPEVKGIVRVTERVSPTEVKVKVIKPLYLEKDKTVPAPTKRWSEGAFSEVRGWPRAACFFEQRLALSGVRGEPERLYFSATADLFNFERTGLDDAGFGFDLAATDSSPVVTLASMGDGLFIGTETGEWIARGGEGRAMSGSSRAALPKNAVGGAGRRPLVFGSKVVFVENSERALREFVFDWQDQNYVVPDLTEVSAHLMRSGIRCIAFARKPAPVIYAVTNDGRLLSCLYRRESKVVAWAEHTTEGKFEWVSVNAGKSAGTDDQVWFIVKRGGVEGEEGGTRYVEKFDDRHFDNLQLAEPQDMLHCDGAVTVEGPVQEVSGLWHLNEKEVVILADGKVHTRAMVAEGKVLLDAEYNNVTVGLPYVSEVQPMPFEMAMDDGVASGRRQKAGPLSVHFFRSLAVKYADSTETPHAERYDLNFRDGADEGAPAPPVFTGWKPMAPAAKFRDSVDVVLSTDEPVPLNILAIAPTSQVYGA